MGKVEIILFVIFLFSNPCYSTYSNTPLLITQKKGTSSFCDTIDLVFLTINGNNATFIVNGALTLSTNIDDLGFFSFQSNGIFCEGDIRDDLVYGGDLIYLHCSKNNDNCYYRLLGNLILFTPPTCSMCTGLSVKYIGIGTCNDIQSENIWIVYNALEISMLYYIAFPFEVNNYTIGPKETIPICGSIHASIGLSWNGTVTFASIPGAQCQNSLVAIPKCIKDELVQWVVYNPLEFDINIFYQFNSSKGQLSIPATSEVNIFGHSYDSLSIKFGISSAFTLVNQTIDTENLPICTESQSSNGFKFKIYLILLCNFIFLFI